MRLTGSIHPHHLGSLIAVDALARHCQAQGRPEPFCDVITLGGDVAVQRAVQRAVAREGADRDDLGRENFALRARQLEAQAEADLQALFSRLGIRADLERWRGTSEAAARTARIAFVRLYEAGLLSRTDAVLDSCPSCETVVDAADVDEAEVDTEVVQIALPLSEGSLQVNLVAPELLVGAVALAVPASLGIEDRSIFVPFRDEEVPVVSVSDLEEPVVVVPGHDRWSYDLARQLGFAVTEVLDGEGIVRHPGALEGLGRHAARAAAIEQLATGGYLVAHMEGRQKVNRCHRCGTVLVPLLGRHWVLPLADLVAPVVDAMHAGDISFSPPTVCDDFLRAAEKTGAWAVSQQLWSGLPIPVYTCLDCGQTQVSVETEISCGACMGTLEAHTDVLDGRFIAVVTPLTMMGWPQLAEDQDHLDTTLLVGRDGLEAWPVPMAALGLRLAGRLPYNRVVIHQSPIGAAELGQRPTRDMTASVEEHGADVVRAAVLTGDFDLDRARQALELLSNPSSGEADVEALRSAYETKLENLDPAGALALLLTTVRDGLGENQTDLVLSMAQPLLGPLHGGVKGGSDLHHTE